MVNNTEGKSTDGQRLKQEGEYLMVKIVRCGSTSPTESSQIPVKAVV